MYRTSSDPWRVAHSWYERRKSQVVAASLRQPFYQLLYDPACGGGEATAHLLLRCAAAVLCDASPTAVERCRDRFGHALRRVEQRVFPSLPFADTDGPDQLPDVMVFSEFLYYLDDRALSITPDVIHQLALRRGALGVEVVLVHWRHQLRQAHHSGELVHAWVTSQLASMGWSHLVHHDDEEYLVEVLAYGKRALQRLE